MLERYGEDVKYSGPKKKLGRKLPEFMMRS
jgi:hypothetical protein